MFTHRLAILLALLLLAAVVLTANAQPMAPTEETFWVQLTLAEVEVGPDTLAPSTPDQILSSLSRQRSVVRAQLEDLKAAGLVADFQLMPGRSLLTFTGNREALRRLREKGLVHASGLGAPDTATLAASTSQIDEWIASQEQPPVGDVFLTPDAITGVTVAMPSGYILGYAPGQDLVNVSVLSPSGSVRGSFADKTWTDGTNHFRMSGVYDGCTRVNPQPGERVRVQAGAQSVTVDVVNLTATVDERTNIVSGTGPANNPITLDLYSSGCSPYPCHATVTTNNSGHYSYNFSSRVNILAGDFVYATRRNSAGHGVQAYASAPQISLDLAAGQLGAFVYGSVRTPGQVRVELRSSTGTLKHWETTETYGINDFEVTIPHPTVAGDQIVVISGGETWQVTIRDLAVQVDPAANRVLGRGPANTTLAVSFNGLNGYTTLQPRTNASGAFSVPVSDSQGHPIDVMGGDEATLNLYDAQRNLQLVEDGADYLQATVSGVNVTGYTTAYQDYTLTLRSPAGAVKETRTGRSSPLDGHFTADFSVLADPGDQLTLAVGQNTRTMTVPTLNAVYNATQRSITGHAPPSSRVWIKAYHSLSRQSTAYQTLSTNSGPLGAYSASLAGTWWGGLIAEGDGAKVMTFDNNDNAGYVQASYGTPQVAWQSVPLSIVPDAYNTVSWLVQGGLHASATYLVWDTVSHAGPDDYAYQTACQNGLAGPFEGHLIGPTGADAVYMRARSYVRNSLGSSPLAYTDERAVPVGGSVETLFVPLLLLRHANADGSAESMDSSATATHTLPMTITITP